MDRVALSKFLSWVLRHEPDAILLSIDSAGWASIDQLIECAARTGRSFTREEVYEVVEKDEKQRYKLSEDRQRIRASQGHSIDVDLEYRQAVPPETLYHGTVQSVVSLIRREGLSKMARTHVHLSSDRAVALRVGGRRGRAVVLLIDSGRMHREGHVFYLSDNGVWLIEHVPPSFIRDEDGSSSS